MLSFVLWYLSITLLGLVTFPLAYRLLPGLPDRGYALCRALGLLAWGYLFWILVSLGFLRNDPGGLIFTFGLVATASLWVWQRLPRGELSAWLRANRGSVVAVEILFFVAFAGWALVRATYPDITGTEKPMELAFINAILRSPTFPPHDPWLSGYAISYYYFGYVLVAMLAKLTGVIGSVAFNLGISLVFALSAVGAYGIAYNLLALVAKERPSSPAVGGRPSLAAFLGPLFVLIVSNLEGFLEVLHARGLFWRTDAAGNLVSPFWAWLDMQELSQPPAQPFSWAPTRYLWWWRASRVLQDYDVAGNWKEIIDEFPFFSYQLADLHPHVLAMPFAFLVMGIALNVFLGGARGRMRWFGLGLRLNTQAFLLGALALGGLAFLNTWDFPIYLALFCGAYVLQRITSEGLGTAGGSAREQAKNLQFEREKVRLAVVEGTPVEGGSSPVSISTSSHYAGVDDAPGVGARPAKGEHRGEAVEGPFRERALTWDLVKDFLGLGLALGLSGVLLYLPFYLGFSSQAGGIVPNLIYVTRGAHFWVMFGTFLLPMTAFLIYLWRQVEWKGYLAKGFLLATGIITLLWILSLAMGFVAARLPLVGEIYLGSIGASGWPISALFQEAVLRRITSLGGLLTMISLLAAVLGLLWPRWKETSPKDEREELEDSRDGAVPVSRTLLPHSFSHPHIFAILLILVGTLLVLGPEFFYLRDQFGWRMNTIFKFYYQAWLLWGVATAYGTAVLLQQLRGRWGVLFSLGLVLVLGMGLVYPIFSLWERTNGFAPPDGFTLDGAAYLERQAPDEMAAIEWLRSAPPGVVLEAVGPQYSAYARVATHSGQPNLLGWPGHESQWRGGGEEMGTRPADIERIYRSNDWDETQTLLQQYNVRYVFVGALERSTYRVNEAKFERFLKPVFQQGDVMIYEVPSD